MSGKIQGAVKWFDAKKGFGFIVPDNGGKDHFVHVTAVEDSRIGELKDGDRVSYELVSSRGKESAANLERA